MAGVAWNDGQFCLNAVKTKIKKYSKLWDLN
jgi:hypothetical protein